MVAGQLGPAHFADSQLLSALLLRSTSLFLRLLQLHRIDQPAVLPSLRSASEAASVVQGRKWVSKDASSPGPAAGGLNAERGAMAVLITGGRGFLGHLLAQQLLQQGELSYGPDSAIAAAAAEDDAAKRSHGRSDTPPSHSSTSNRGERVVRAITRIVVLDMFPPSQEQQLAGLEHVVGDICDNNLLRSLIVDGRVDSVFHLAAVLSGQAEMDYELGMKVNVDATRLILECCRSGCRRPCLVMPSSVAVFGRPSVAAAGMCEQATTCAMVSEDSPVLPASSYGTEKGVCELLLSDATRRSFVDARTVRLPTVVVRPGLPSSATSSFCSAIVREPLNGKAAVCPVDPDLPLWVQSPEVAVQNLIHAHNVDLHGASPIVTLPGLTTTPRQMVAAMAECGGDASLVEWHHDEFVNSIVASWPGAISTPCALRLGFARDNDILSIVRKYCASLKQNMQG